MRIVRIFLAVLAISALLPSATLADEEKEPAADVFAQAEKLYSAGDWDKAGKLLKETLVSRGADNLPGAFFFNLGSALARSGKLGEGYVALQRAFFALPFDTDVRHNLRKVEQALPVSTRAVKPATWIPFWPSALRPISWRYWLLAGLCFSAMALYLLSAADKVIPWTAGIAAALLLAAAGITGLQARLPVAGVVTLAKVKSGPGNTFTDIGSLEPGSLVNDDGERDGWRKVRFRKGDSEETVGWVEPAGLLGVR